jgi:protein SCO1/2
MIKRVMNAATLLLTLSLAGGATLAAPKGTPWGADHFPNVPLVTQDGKTVQFYDELMKDRKVLVNFIFTSCSQSCPLDTAKMAQMQKLLGSRIGRDIFMYSITLDPENDTPGVLKAYAEQFGAGPGWLFLSGRREDIDRIRARLGENGEKEEHANSVRVGDVAKGQWMRLPLTADAKYLVTEINNTFDPGWSAGKTLKSIAEAPRPEVFGPGQLLFHNRCAACHGFGRGDQLGPDLKGVTARRDRAWLFRFLAAPEKMRAGKDPIATELAKRYKVLMPNLALTNKELEDLMAYLEAQSVPRAKPDTPPATVVAPVAADETRPAADGHHDHHHHHTGAPQ